MSNYKCSLGEIEIEWTDDCCGKKDFDGSVLYVSSRYWPRGGGFFTFDTETKKFETNESRPEIKPSAISHLIFGDTDIAKMECEAETEEEVKQMVEDWVKVQIEKISRCLEAMRQEKK